MFSRLIVSDSSRPDGLQYTRPLCPSPSPRVCPSSCSLHRWCCLTVSSSVALFSFCLESALNQALFQWVSCSHQVTKFLDSASASILLMSSQGWFPLRLVWSPCCPRDSSQESSPAPQFKSVNSGALPSLWSSSQNSTWLLERPSAVVSCSIVSDSLRPQLQPTRFLCPWGFSRQEYWSGLSCPPARDLPKPGIEPRSPALRWWTLH